MNKLNWNKVLTYANIIIGAILIGDAVSMLLGYETLNQPSQVAILLIVALMFFQNARDELLKSENEGDK